MSVIKLPELQIKMAKLFAATMRKRKEKGEKKKETVETKDYDDDGNTFGKEKPKDF